MPLREAFYLGAAYQIDATVRLSGPADKSAALFGASRLDPYGALSPRINRAEALCTSPLNRARVRAGLAASAQTEHPKSEFSDRGRADALRIWPSRRLIGPWSDFLILGEGSPLPGSRSHVMRALARPNFQ